MTVVDVGWDIRGKNVWTLPICLTPRRSAVWRVGLSKREAGAHVCPASGHISLKRPCLLHYSCPTAKHKQTPSKVWREGWRYAAKGIRWHPRDLLAINIPLKRGAASGEEKKNVNVPENLLRFYYLFSLTRRPLSLVFHAFAPICQEMQSSGAPHLRGLQMISYPGREHLEDNICCRRKKKNPK